VVAAKVPSGRTAAITAGTPANSWVSSKALESSSMLVAHAEPAWPGPTDPDTVTLSPAVTERGLTRRATGGVVVTARTVSVADTPRFPPPQRPLIV